MIDRAILTQPCCDCDAGTVVEILSTDSGGREFKIKTPNGSAWLVFGDALERIQAPTIWARLLGDPLV